MKALDIIQKKQVFQHDPNVFEQYRGKKVWITGICGSIGWSLAKKLRSYGANVGGIDCNEERIAKIGNCHKDMFDRLVCGFYSDILPVDEDYIFHCAAFKHVRLAPLNTIGYETNNATMVHHFVERLYSYEKTGKKPIFVLCSTDKAAGSSVMGKSKREAEIHTVFYGKHALRLVNIAYSRGSVLSRWRDDRVKKVCDGSASRYWMQMDDAVYALCSVALEKPGLYTVHNVPSFTMEEMRKAWEKEFCQHKWKKFEMFHEAMSERLVSENEKMSPISETLARIE